MNVHERLISLKACKEARGWAAQYQTAQEVWDNCTRIDWLFWWAAREGQLGSVVSAAKEIAQSVSHLKGTNAAYAAYAAACAAAAAAAYAAAYAVVSAAYAAADAAGAAADAAASAKQEQLNMQIARKHLHCPTW